VSEAKAGAAADSVRAERGTSAGRTESARAQDEAERTKVLEQSIKKKPERSERIKITPQEFERSEADGSNLLSGPTQEDRRADYWRSPRGAELLRARRWPGRRATGGDYYLPERGTSAGQVVVSEESGSARAEVGRAFCFEATRRAGFSHMRGSRRVAFQTSPLLRLTISGTRQRAIRRARWTV